MCAPTENASHCWVWVPLGRVLAPRPPRHSYKSNGEPKIFDKKNKKILKIDDPLFQYETKAMRIVNSTKL
jgi:hypothetical protein